MQAQFIGYGIAKGISDAGFWFSISLLLIFAPFFWRNNPLQILKPIPGNYPEANITEEAIKNLKGQNSDYPLFDSSRNCLLKQFWAIELRNLIERKIIEKRDNAHFLINSINPIIAPFTNDLPVFLLNVLCNDGWEGTIHITAEELGEAIPSLETMDWRKITNVGNLYQVLTDLGPVIQYEETIRRIS